MKLVLLLVVLIAAFTAYCRELPDLQQIEALTDDDFTEKDQYTQNGAKETDQNIDEKEYSYLDKVAEAKLGMELRGNKDKKDIKEIVDVIVSLDSKLSLAIIKQNVELNTMHLKQNDIIDILRTLRNHQDAFTNNITESNKDLEIELQNIGDNQDDITDGIKDLKDELNSMMKNITDTNTELQMLKKVIIDSNSQLKTDVSSLSNATSIILSKLNSLSTNLDCQGIGVFKVGKECFKVLRDKQRTWQDAQTACTSHNLILAEPDDKNAIALRKYMVDTYGHYECWVGARGDGSKMVFQTSQKYILKDNTLVDTGRGDSKYMSSNFCLELDANPGEYKADPNAPYDVHHPCTEKRWPLCEVH